MLNNYPNSYQATLKLQIINKANILKIQKYFKYSKKKQPYNLFVFLIHISLCVQPTLQYKKQNVYQIYPWKLMI